MTAVLRRPPQPDGSRGGLMRREHFQVAYVTNDLDRACAALGERYGISDYSYIDGAMEGGGSIRVAFAWVGSTMYEIIDARGGQQSDFYTDRLPGEGFAIVFHHLGHLIHDPAEWQAVRREITESGLPVAFLTENPGFMDAIYIEAPELGHYLEYIRPDPAGLDFFHAVPAN